MREPSSGPASFRHSRGPPVCGLEASPRPSPEGAAQGPQGSPSMLAGGRGGTHLWARSQQLSQEPPRRPCLGTGLDISRFTSLQV